VLREFGDREVQMRPTDDVAGRADVTDHISLLDLLAGREPLGVLGEVAIEEEVTAARVFLINRPAPAPLPRDANDLAIRRRQGRRAPRSADVDRQMLVVPATGGEERVLKLRGVHPLDGNLKAGRE